ncbi:Tir C-terminal domain-containing protein, partial [Escherichia coli]|nr:type III secretion system LEE translocated intimin receptor Tir [Escherichia coli]
GGGIGVAVTAALHRKNQPVEQTTTTTTTTTSARTVENKPANNTPAQGNVDTPGSEDTMESRRSSMASTSSTFFDTSSIGTVQNPYADVKTSLHDSQVPTSNSNTSVQNMGNTDSVVYSTIQHPPRDTTDNGARLLGNPSAGIQSTYARLALSGGLRHDMGGLTGGSNSAVNTSNNPPAPGSHRFV